MDSCLEAIRAEVNGLYGEDVLRDLHEIIGLYNMYDGTGQDWEVSDELDYKPAKKRTNFIKKIIKEQARFLFGRTPEFSFICEDDETKIRIEQFFNGILNDNNFTDKIIKAARDCFIGKRVAVKLAVIGDGEDRKVKITFVPSMGFVYTPEDEDADFISSIVFFHSVNDVTDKNKQRVWKQKYYMEGGRCFVDEGFYDGYGRAVEERLKKTDTGLSFIPAKVIVNDGLSGDLKGESDVSELIEMQDLYNRITSDDVDALRFNMFPQTVAVNAGEESLKGLTISPAALIDLQGEYAQPDMTPQIFKLESAFSYDARIENTLNRLKSDMHELLSVPNISAGELRGYLNSGKSMRALYWQLITRCEEKFTCWRPALIWLCKSVLKIAEAYGLLDFDLPEDLIINVENVYPLMEDEYEEKRSDLEAVGSGVMSRTAYIKKWNNSFDDLLAAKELELIKEEVEVLGWQSGNAALTI